ncbi:MAG: hypothetical protein HQ518_10175 [Rhodopirellula sp.]|jgi:Spy/CpxP family protein refolding chaperone|nr:hypothetical protein [Rhodopirellula sp.]
MNQRFASMVVVAGLALAVGTHLSVESTVGQEKAATKAAPAKVAKKAAGRLPAQYGKLGLSDEQRDKIYGVQATYRKQIDDLQKQIDALKEKQDTEVQGVLTADQKKKLEELLADAKKAAAEKSSKKKSS